MSLRILIVGGMGFLGGRLTNYFESQGNEVIIGSRFPVSKTIWNQNLESVLIDWESSKALIDVCRNIDVIIHAAGMNANDCFLDPIAALNFNGLATTRLVSAAAQAGVKKFIYFSTAHVYSNPLSGSLTEEVCPKNLHPYATSHLAGEQAVLYSNKISDMDGIVLRLSNAFGFPMNHGVNCWMLLINDLCRQAVENNSLYLKSSGVQLRDFIPIKDVCSVVNDLLVYPNALNSSGLLNLCSGKSRSIIDIANLIKTRSSLILSTDLHVNLNVNEGLIDEEVIKFSLNSKLLDNFVYQQDEDIFISEIDDLLLFCLANFKNP